jgi:hypothetical protein
METIYNKKNKQFLKNSNIFSVCAIDIAKIYSSLLGLIIILNDDQYNFYFN